MALTRYLSQIDNVQEAFSVKQQKPTTLDAAVSATLEMESYLGPKLEVAGVEEHTDTVAAAMPDKATGTVMKKLLERMERLETELSESRKERRDYMQKRKPTSYPQQGNSGYRPGGRPRSVPTCWNCGQRGHVIRDCWNQPNQPYQGSRQQGNQGNEHPSVGQPLEGHEHVGQNTVISTLTCSGSYRISSGVGGVRASLLVNTGSPVTLLSGEVWDKIKSDETLVLKPSSLLG